MYICDKCFKDVDKEEHQDWCPYKKQQKPSGYDAVEELKKMFGIDINSK